MANQINLSDPQALQRASEQYPAGEAILQTPETLPAEPVPQQPLEPTEQYESTEEPMSFSEWVGRQERNKKKAIIYGMIGISRADKLFKEQPYLSLADQLKIAQTMISDTQLDLMQAYEQAQKEDDPVGYFKETFEEDFGDLKQHEMTLYRNRVDKLESRALANARLEVAKNKNINKHEKAVFNKINKQYKYIATGKNGWDNAMMQVFPNLGLREVKVTSLTGGELTQKEVAKSHFDAVKSYHEENVLTFNIDNKNALAMEIQNSYDMLEAETRKGIRSFAFIGKPGEERVQGKNYFELINGEPSDEMKDADGFESWNKNVEYIGSPGSVDDRIVQSALLKLKNIIDITQSSGEVGWYFSMGEGGKGYDEGLSEKKARNRWFETMMDEYEKYKDSLINASTVTLEEEEEILDRNDPRFWEKYKVKEEE